MPIFAKKIRRLYIGKGQIMTDDTDEKITLQQAAQLTGIPLRTLQTWAKQGKIKGAARERTGLTGTPAWYVSRQAALSLPQPTEGRPLSQNPDIVALAQRVSRQRRRAKEKAAQDSARQGKAKECEG